MSSRTPLAAFTNLGDLLRYLRRRAQLSQRELAIAVGYSESHLSRIETNERPLDRATLLARFAPALQVEDEAEILARLLALCGEQDAGATNHVSLPTTMSANRRADGGRLPAPLTSFVGRDEEIAETRQLLHERRIRLLTLIGAGGCGKTRLALRLGELLTPSHIAAVWFVELASLAEPDLLPRVIADTLAIRERTGQPLTLTITESIGTNRALLILDNCEHLVDAVVDLVMQMLNRCPQLQILATSRVMLNIPGETCYRVQPLALPPARRNIPPSSAAIAGYDAIRLFVERAGAALHNFQLTDRNAPAIMRICRRLDGIPLGIELAAPWVRLLSPDQIADRLDTSFDLLAGDLRTVLPRHKTMRAAIDWSYALLSESARTLLRRLAVFNGGWSLAVAETILSDQDGRPMSLSAGDILANLKQLTDASLILVESALDGEARYRLLEPLREYAREKLSDAGEEPWLRGRHLNYYRALAEMTDTALHVQPRADLLDRLDQEQENLRAALDWSLTLDTAMEGLRLATALGRFWRHRGYYTEGRRWLNAMLARNPEASPIRARALLWTGVLARLQHEHGEARRLSNECLTLGARYDDLELIALAQENIGWICMDTGDTNAAGDAFAASLAGFRTMGLRRQHARVLVTLAQLAREQGNAEHANTHLDEALRIARETSDPQSISQSLSGLSELRCLTGDYAGAYSLLREGLNRAQAAGNQQDLAWITCSLAEICRYLGEFSAAVDYAERGIEFFERLGSVRGQAIAAHHLGLARYAQHDLDAAEQHLSASLKLSRLTNDDLMVARCQAGLAGIALARGETLQASSLLSAATATFVAHPRQLTPADQAWYEDLCVACRTILAERRLADGRQHRD